MPTYGTARRKGRDQIGLTYGTVMPVLYSTQKFSNPRSLAFNPGVVRD